MGVPVLCTYSRMLFQEHFEVDSSVDLRVSDVVVLKTRRGMEVGRVAAEPGSTKLKRSEGIVGTVIRKAEQQDIESHREEYTRVQVPQALKRARELGRELKLDMHFVDTEKTIDQKKTIFYFLAPQRVDFRELVKRLASEINQRIELRQIGARDVARLTGDVGSCGEELCCKTFLIDFIPVSMKMAKNQNLSLESAKISGMCGRLKCCLKYEDDLYTAARKTMPRRGQPVVVKESGDEGWVQNVSLLDQMLTVKTANGREELSVDAVDYDKSMTEREIRKWQKERREQEYYEREQRRQQKQDREQRRSARRQAVSEGTNENSSAGESQTREDSPRKAGADEGPGKKEQGSEPQSQGEGEQAKKKSRRGRRGRRRGGRGRGKKREGDQSGPSQKSD